MDVAAELGRNPVSKYQIQPEYGDEQADAGRDCQTRLARPNSQARTRTGKYSFFPFQLTTSRIGNLTRLVNTLAICVTIHTSPRQGVELSKRIGENTGCKDVSDVALCRCCHIISVVLHIFYVTLYPNLLLGKPKRSAILPILIIVLLVVPVLHYTIYKVL